MNDNWELLRNILPNAPKATIEREGHIGLKKKNTIQTKQNKTKLWLEEKVETDMKDTKKNPPKNKKTKPQTKNLPNQEKWKFI